MKRFLGVLFALLMIQTVSAQRAGGFRFQMELGPAIPKDGGIGALVNLEPQILVMDNLAVGIRVGAVALAKDVTYYSIPDDYDGEVGANGSMAGTLNYYFNYESSRVAPYIGVGYGYYALSNVDIQEDDDLDNEVTGDLVASFAWSPMLRAGIELGKFRMGAEYNFVPNSDLQDTNGAVIGEAVNQYFGFTLGFFVGGGKWGKYRQNSGD